MIERGSSEPFFNALNLCHPDKYYMENLFSAGVALLVAIVTFAVNAGAIKTKTADLENRLKDLKSEMEKRLHELEKKTDAIADLRQSIAVLNTNFENYQKFNTKQLDQLVAAVERLADHH
jgi:uncharacterized protein YoxC